MKDNYLSSVEMSTAAGPNIQAVNLNAQSQIWWNWNTIKKSL